jgi:hypothetical protein
MQYSWHRDMRGRIDGLVQDVRYAARTLRKNSGFTLVAIAMLGLGIGINALVFTVADTVLYRGFPLVQRNDRLLYMTSGRGCCVSYPDFEDWRAQARSFEGMALVHGLQQTFDDGGGVPEIVVLHGSHGQYLRPGWPETDPWTGFHIGRRDSRVRSGPHAALQHVGQSLRPGTRRSSAAPCESTACRPP